MLSIGDRMERFRNASVHLWNEYLSPGEDIVDVGIEESYDVIERELLRVLVLKECPEQADAYRREPIKCLLITLHEGTDPGSILQSVTADNGTNVLQPLQSEQIPKGALHFQEFYDWQHYSKKVSNDLVKVADGNTGNLYVVPEQACIFWLDLEAAAQAPR